MNKRILGVLIVMSVIVIGIAGVAWAVDTYTFRNTTFELGSECAELFVIYHDAQYYDIWTKAPALMKFDKTCNPQAP